MVTLGTGVGGGIVLNNKIYTGFNFAGAELGHSVIVVDGRPCTCERRGCLEAYASATRSDYYYQGIHGEIQRFRDVGPGRARS